MGKDEHGNSRSFVSHIRFRQLILTAVCFLVFFLNLGGWDLWDPDEPRYAEVAREMLISGNWTLPHLNGEIYFHKPPFFFWLIALSTKVWGEISSFAARFPSALFASLTVFLTYWFGKKIFNRRAGLISALILATNVEFVWLARRANIDATLTFFTTLTIISFYLAIRHPNRRFLLYFIGFLSMGVGFLTKPQVACIVPGLTIIIFIIATRESHVFKEKKLFLSFIAFLLPVFAWLAAAYYLGGNEYLKQLLYHKTTAIFFEKVSHPKPFYYYLKNFPFDFFPGLFFCQEPLFWPSGRLTGNGRK